MAVTGLARTECLRGVSRRHYLAKLLSPHTERYSDGARFTSRSARDAVLGSSATPLLVNMMTLMRVNVWSEQWRCMT